MCACSGLAISLLHKMPDCYKNKTLVVNDARKKYVHDTQTSKQHSKVTECILKEVEGGQ